MGSDVLQFSTLNCDDRIDAHTFIAIESQCGLDLVRQTRLGQMCGSGEVERMGSQTSIVNKKNVKVYARSNVNCFAVRARRHTPTQRKYGATNGSTRQHVRS